MIKKIFLLFCCFNIFALSPVFAGDGRIFIDPKVASFVITKYFGHLVSDRKFPQYTSFLTDEIILSNVLRTWQECIMSDKDNLVSTRCIAEVCKTAFGHGIYEESKYTFVKSETNEYCKRFGFELINNKADQQDVDCMYSVTKKNGSQSQIQYKAYDDSGFVRSGGTIPWRFFNPGALRRSSLACTRLDTKPNGLFAVFESYEKGRQALHRVLRGEDYRNLTIAQAITKYAPKKENDTPRYIRNVKNSLKSVRSDVDTLKLSDLTDSQLDVLMNAIQQIEGWNRSGEVTVF